MRARASRAARVNGANPFSIFAPIDFVPSAVDGQLISHDSVRAAAGFPDTGRGVRFARHRGNYSPESNELDRGRTGSFPTPSRCRRKGPKRTHPARENSECKLRFLFIYNASRCLRTEKNLSVWGWRDAD